MSDDRTLIARFLGGDQGAFDQLVLKYQEQIRRFIFRSTGNVEDSDDLAQEVFIKAYKNLYRFRGESQLATWLYRIAVNIVNSHYRRQRLREWLPLGEYPAPAEYAADDDSSRRRRALLAALPRLSSQERKVVILRGLQELTVKNTAQILGTTGNVVKVAFHTARKKLKGMLKDV